MSELGAVKSLLIRETPDVRLQCVTRFSLVSNSNSRCRDASWLLREKHAVMRALLDMVRSSPKERRQRAVTALSEAANVYRTAAERHVYPMLGRLGYPKLQASVRLHESFGHSMEQLRALSKENLHFFAELDTLALRLEEHLTDEEQSLIPFLILHADSRSLRELGDDMARTSDELERQDPEMQHRASDLAG